MEIMTMERPTKLDISLEEFLDKNKGLAFLVLNRFKRAVEFNTLMTMEDAEQYALIGLCKVYERFDPSYGYKLSTIALPIIRGEVLKGFRDYDSGAGVNFSRVAKELSRRCFADKEPEEMTEEFVKSVQKEEGVTDYIIESAVDFYWHCTTGVVYVDKTVDKGEDSDSDTVVLDLLVSHVDSYDGETIISKFRNTLEGKDLIIFDGLGEGLTQSAVGKLAGVSQVQVGRIRNKLYARYKEFEKEEKAYDY